MPTIISSMTIKEISSVSDYISGESKSTLSLLAFLTLFIVLSCSYFVALIFECLQLSEKELLLIVFHVHGDPAC